MAAAMIACLDGYLMVWVVIRQFPNILLADTQIQSRLMGDMLETLIFLLAGGLFLLLALELSRESDRRAGRLAGPHPQPAGRLFRPGPTLLAVITGLHILRMQFTWEDPNHWFFILVLLFILLLIQDTGHL